MKGRSRKNNAKRKGGGAKARILSLEGANRRLIEELAASRHDWDELEVVAMEWAREKFLEWKLRAQVRAPVGMGPGMGRGARDA